MPDPCRLLSAKRLPEQYGPNATDSWKLTKSSHPALATDTPAAKERTDNHDGLSGWQLVRQVCTPPLFLSLSLSLFSFSLSLFSFSLSLALSLSLSLSLSPLVFLFDNN